MDFRDACNALYERFRITTDDIVKLTGWKKWEVQYARTNDEERAKKYTPPDWRDVLAGAIERHAQELAGFAQLIRGDALAPGDEAAAPPRVAMLGSAKVFFSDEMIGTGEDQLVAHGLGQVPNETLAIPTDLSHVARGGGTWWFTHDPSTAGELTVKAPAGARFRVLAVAIPAAQPAAAPVRRPRGRPRTRTDEAGGTADE